MSVPSLFPIIITLMVFRFWLHMESRDRFYFLRLQIHWDSDSSHEIKRCLLFGRKAMTNLDSILKKQRHEFAHKGLFSQSCGFSSSHIWMWELDHKPGWAPKNWCFWIVVLKKTLDSTLDREEIKSVNSTGDQLWVFTGRTDAEAETPILWPSAVKNWPIWKDPDSGKDWVQEEKGVTEDEMVGWHHQLNGCEFEQTLGDSEGQGNLVCCSPWGHKQ